MQKFNKTYRFQIETNDGGDLAIELPFSVNFSIERNLLNSANNAIFNFYNLNETTRLRMAKDVRDLGNQREILFLAGYDNNLSSAFTGNVSRCFSERVGSDFVTTVECYDGGFAYANADVKGEYRAGTSRKAIIQDIINKMKPFGVEVGAIGDFQGKIERGNSYSGNAMSILSGITGGASFIDDGKLYVLKDNEVTEGNLRVIDDNAGLIGTPIRDETVLTFEMLFEPQLLIGQRITLNSSTAKNYNQEYKVQAFEHAGIISRSVSGDAKTKVTLLFGNGPTPLVTTQGSLL